MDKERIKFHSNMIVIAEKDFRASCSNEEADAFVDRIFKEYKDAGTGCEAEKWLRERLKSEFLWIDKPPQWVEDESAWPYLDDKPMVFLRQFSIPKSPMTEEHVGANDEIYVFGLRTEVKGEGSATHRVEYRVVVQIPEIGGAEQSE